MKKEKMLKKLRKNGDKITIRDLSPVEIEKVRLAYLYDNADRPLLRALFSLKEDNEITQFCFDSLFEDDFLFESKKNRVLKNSLKRAYALKISDNNTIFNSLSETKDIIKDYLFNNGINEKDKDYVFQLAKEDENYPSYVKMMNYYNADSNVSENILKENIWREFVDFYRMYNSIDYDTYDDKNSYEEIINVLLIGMIAEISRVMMSYDKDTKYVIKIDFKQRKGENKNEAKNS